MFNLPQVQPVSNIIISVIRMNCLQLLQMSRSTKSSFSCQQCCTKCCIVYKQMGSFNQGTLNLVLYFWCLNIPDLLVPGGLVLCHGHSNNNQLARSLQLCVPTMIFLMSILFVFAPVWGQTPFREGGCVTELQNLPPNLIPTAVVRQLRSATGWQLQIISSTAVQQRIPCWLYLNSVAMVTGETGLWNWYIVSIWLLIIVYIYMFWFVNNVK